MMRYRRGGRRGRLLRQILATSLIVSAAVLASLTPQPADGGTAVIAAARDLAVGTTLTRAELTTASVRSPPDGFRADLRDVLGRILAAPVRRGEILTDVRLADDSGPRAGAGRAAVPVTITDAGIAALLRPGLHVTVVSVTADRFGSGNSEAEVTVLTEDAVIMSLSEVDRVVLIAVPQQAANRVTAAAAAGTIALRFG